ncbi:hypothetical protein [Nocardioides sp. AN3]
MSDTPPDKTPLLGVDWIKAVAGALAAVSTTVLLSTLGAAGTLVGAALGSLAATIATAAYSQGLDRSRARVRQLSSIAGRPVVVQSRRVGSPGPEAVPVDSEVSSEDGWLERLRQLPWSRLLPATLVMFLIVLAAVTAFELASGRTLAAAVRGGHGGGTTISHVTTSGGGTKHQKPSPTGAATPTPGSTPSNTAGPAAPPSAEQSTTAPSTAPSESPTPTAQATEPSQLATGTPTPALTGGPSPDTATAPAQ